MNEELEVRIRSLSSGISLRWDEELDDFDATFGSQHNIDPEDIDFADADLRAMYEREVNALAEDFLARAQSGNIEAVQEDDLQEIPEEAESFSALDDPDAIPDPEDM